MSAAPLFDVTVHRSGREEITLRLGGDEPEPAVREAPEPVERERFTDEERVLRLENGDPSEDPTAGRDAPILACARKAEALGINVVDLLNEALVAESAVREAKPVDEEAEKWKHIAAKVLFFAHMLHYKMCADPAEILMNAVTRANRDDYGRLATWYFAAEVRRELERLIREEPTNQQIPNAAKSKEALLARIAEGHGMKYETLRDILARAKKHRPPPWALNMLARATKYRVPLWPLYLFARELRSRGRRPGPP